MILADRYSRPLTDPSIIPDLNYSKIDSSNREVVFLDTLTNFEVLNEPGSGLIVYLNENPV
jgi:regulatory protein YycI of two-component signal transduction system YycFG